MTIKILVCAPVAPPLGGIATWSEELKSLNFYDKGFGVNIFPTNIPGRKSRMYGYFYRLINGLFYGIPFVLRYFVELVVGRYSVVHVCTSGGFAHFRDIFLLSVANLFGIKTIIHLHFGCVDQGYKWVPGGRLFLQLAAKLAEVCHRCNRSGVADLTGNSRVGRIQSACICILGHDCAGWSRPP